ncbi:MAG: hypothetical protein EBV23_11090 [Flavobacteriia bacterium]|nr:hypothetical protein [Flavobacteriia bacterium]
MSIKRSFRIHFILFLKSIVETHKVPVIKKIGWYLNLKNRQPGKFLPKSIFRIYCSIACAFCIIKEGLYNKRYLNGIPLWAFGMNY